MLSCGAIWRPNTIDRVIETFNTSTRVVKVMTNEGIGFLKGIGNPAGLESLASELVGSELAVCIGLNVPPFSVIDIRDILIPMFDGGQIGYGPAFVSKQVNAETGDVNGIYLRKLTGKHQIALLVIFDTWVRNGDRCPPPDFLDPEPRRDNLLFAPDRRGYELVVFDHTHCFFEANLEESLTGNNFVDDNRIYGLFPEFVPYLDVASVEDAVIALRNVEDDAVERIVHSLPPQWGVTAKLRSRWTSALIERRDRVADNIAGALVGQLHMNL